MLYSIYKDRINENTLREAIEKTSKYRRSFEIVLQYREIAALFNSSESIKNLWQNYINTNTYAKNIDFLDTVYVYKKIGDTLNT